MDTESFPHFTPNLEEENKMNQAQPAQMTLFKVAKNYRQPAEVTHGQKNLYTSLRQNKLFSILLAFIKVNLDLMDGKNRTFEGKTSDMCKMFRDLGISYRNEKELDEVLGIFKSLRIEKGFGFRPMRMTGFNIFGSWDFQFDKNKFHMRMSEEFYKIYITNGHYSKKDVYEIFEMKRNGTYVLHDLILKDFTKKEDFTIWEDIDVFKSRFNDKKRWVDFKRSVLEPAFQESNTILARRFNSPFWYQVSKERSKIKQIKIIRMPRNDTIAPDGKTALYEERGDQWRLQSEEIDYMKPLSKTKIMKRKEEEKQKRLNAKKMLREAKEMAGVS